MVLSPLPQNASQYEVRFLKKIHLLYIHISILLSGFSALFAQLISQNPLVITFGRVFFSTIFLALIATISRQSIKIGNIKDKYFFVIAGFILAIHWSSFIFAIQSSSVAIGTITFATFPVFIAFLEPLLFRTKFNTKNLFFACLSLIGVCIIAINPSNYGNNAHYVGIIFGLLASISYAFLVLLNKRFSSRYNWNVILFHQQGIAALLLLPIMLIIRPSVGSLDFGLLLVYGILFTAISHGLFVKGLRTTKGSTAGIISGLEPIYAIAFSAILLAEIPRLQELMGGIIVVLVAVYITVRREPPTLTKTKKIQ